MCIFPVGLGADLKMQIMVNKIIGRLAKAESNKVRICWEFQIET